MAGKINTERRKTIRPLGILAFFKQGLDVPPVFTAAYAAVLPVKTPQAAPGYAIWAARGAGLDLGAESPELGAFLRAWMESSEAVKRQRCIRYGFAGYQGFPAERPATIFPRLSVLTVAYF